MRKDIEIHIQTGDIALKSQASNKLRDFQWAGNPNGLSRYIYGEITIPHTVTENEIIEDGVDVFIPYTPIFKEFMIKIKRVFENGSGIYLTNPTNGSEWFIVTSSKYGGPSANIYASELITIGTETYHIQLNGGIAEIYSNFQTDLNIIDANRQNSNCMLACVPTNSYRYPLTGVGLIQWVNSTNMTNSRLTEILQREFTNDGVRIKDASYNYDTGQMELNIDAANT